MNPIVRGRVLDGLGRLEAQLEDAEMERGISDVIVVLVE